MRSKVDAGDEQQAIPIVLLADALATEIDAALAAAASAGGPCRILALAAQGVPTPGGPGPIELAAVANSQRGFRAASRIAHLVPIGNPQLLAAQFSVEGRPLRTQRPPSIVAHWGGSSADVSDALHILTPERCNDTVNAQITRWQRDLESASPSSGGADWATTKIALPNDEMLLQPGLGPLCHHVVRSAPLDRPTGKLTTTYPWSSCRSRRSSR
eukprot:7484291-Pyramimonas_sp.AAC.1